MTREKHEMNGQCLWMLTDALKEEIEMLCRHVCIVVLLIEHLTSQIYGIRIAGNVRGVNGYIAYHIAKGR